jgi:hypothetical protein
LGSNKNVLSFSNYSKIIPFLFQSKKLFQNTLKWNRIIPSGDPALDTVFPIGIEEKSLETGPNLNILYAL